MNSASVNTEVYLSFQSMVFYGYMLRNGPAGSYGSSIFSFSYIFSLRTAQSLSHVSLFMTPWTIDHQGSLSIGFFRNEYWSGFPVPTPEESS